MIQLRELATMRAALLFWQEEMCPSGSTIMQPYYDVAVNAPLLADEITALRAKLGNSCVRYAAYDTANGRLAGVELIADAEDVVRQADAAGAIATVLIPAQRKSIGNKLDSDETESPLRPTFDVYNAEVDGVTVVHVCTDGLPEDAIGPIIRIYLNDEPIFENPRYPSS